MNRCFASQRRACDLATAIGDYFVDVHVELSTASGHPHVQREHVLMLASEDLIAGMSDEFVLLIAQPLAIVVGDGSSLLQNGVSGDHFAGDQILANAEMFERALSLSTPELVCRYLDHAETIGFFSHIGHTDFSLSHNFRTSTAIREPKN